MRRRDLLGGVPLFLVAACVRSADSRPLQGGSVPGAGGGGGGDGSFRVENHDDSGHMHWFQVTCVDLDDHVLEYTALGPHTHQVTLTDDDLDAILAGDAVTVQTTSLHLHTWIFQLPATAC